MLQVIDKSYVTIEWMQVSSSSEIRSHLSSVVDRRPAMQSPYARAFRPATLPLRVEIIKSSSTDRTSLPSSHNHSDHSTSAPGLENLVFALCARAMMCAMHSQSGRVEGREAKVGIFLAVTRGSLALFKNLPCSEVPDDFLVFARNLLQGWFEGLKPGTARSGRVWSVEGPFEYGAGAYCLVAQQA